MLKLTEEIRAICSRPYGTLYSGTTSEVFLKIKKITANRLFACVGDVVSYNSLKNGLKPNIFVIDGKIKRERADSKFLNELYEMSKDYKEIKTRNVPGHITEDLVISLHDILIKTFRIDVEKYRIFVEGEEDLSVIPLAIFMPENSIIIYGQPDKGVVLINLKRDVKLEIYNLTRKMIPVNDNGSKILELFEGVLRGWKYI